MGKGLWNHRPCSWLTTGDAEGRGLILPMDTPPKPWPHQHQLQPCLPPLLALRSVPVKRLWMALRWPPQGQTSSLAASPPVMPVSQQPGCNLVWCGVRFVVVQVTCVPHVPEHHLLLRVAQWLGMICMFYAPCVMRDAYPASTVCRTMLALTYRAAQKKHNNQTRMSRPTEVNAAAHVVASTTGGEGIGEVFLGVAEIRRGKFGIAPEK